MACTGKNHLRRWEFPAGRGILVREIVNRSEGSDFGSSYRVTVPARLAGVRRFKQFASIETAAKWATQQHDSIRTDGKKHFSLSAAQRKESQTALAILAETGRSLIQVAKNAKKHFALPAGSLSVEQVIALLLAEKTAENLRTRSLGDLRSHRCGNWSELLLQGQIPSTNRAKTSAGSREYLAFAMASCAATPI